MTPLELPQVPAPAPSEDDPEARVKQHQRAALTLLAEGQPAKAFAELVRASREVPMSRRLAASLVHVALAAGSGPAAITLLTTGLDETEGAVRIDVRRQLARLARKLGGLERAREELVMVLAEKSADRRARRALNSLLLREERWEELDASLDKETRQELKRGAIRRGARAALARARLWGERLANPGHAALWYVQAATLLEQARDFEGSFTLRLLWLRALHAASAPEGQINEAVRRTIEVAERVGQGQRARALVQELGLLASGEPSSAPAPPPATGRKITQEILIAVAEDAEAKGKKPEAAALFTAAVMEGPDPVSQRRLEAHYVRRGAWRELSQFYRERAQQARSPQEKVELLGRMAEVLEDELKDPVEAARAYGEIVSLTGDKGALAEQVRLLSSREDASGLQRALDQAVERAADGLIRADALVVRAEAAVARQDRDGARRDFEQALQALPDHLPSLAGLAELVSTPEAPQSALRFKDALGKLPRRHPGRVAMLRRLGGVAERLLSDLELACWAWTEVLAELPGDKEALRKSSELGRVRRDDALLETALRGLIALVPRGPKARLERMELVALLDRVGRGEEALSELRTAVRFEPGHKEAWLSLHERLVARGDLDEAAWALEQGATSTEDEAERADAWDRLAVFCREQLEDSERADTYARRANNVRSGLLDPRAGLELPRRPGRDATAVGVVLPTSREERSAGAEPPEPPVPVLAPAPQGSAPKPDPRWVPGVAGARVDARGSAPKLDPRLPAKADPQSSAPKADPRVAARADPSSSAPKADPRLVPGVAGARVDARGSAPKLDPRLPSRPEPRGSAPKADPRLLGGPPVPSGSGPKQDPRRPLEGAPTEFELPAHLAVPPAEAPTGRHPLAGPPVPGDEEIVTGKVRALASAEDDDRHATDEMPAAQLAPNLDPNLTGQIRVPTVPTDEERHELFEAVRADPLSVSAYRDLADYFDELGDRPRSLLMAEIADALAGKLRASGDTPRLMMTREQRSALRHPALRSEAGELLSLAGSTLVRLYPTQGRAAGSNDAFTLESGRGALAAANALFTSVRVLGLHSPEVFLSEEMGPPFSLVSLDAPRLLVGRAVVKKAVPEPELRFFAARALFTQSPDLLLLRSLNSSELAEVLSVLEEVVRGKSLSPPARAVREALHPKALARLVELHPRVMPRVDLHALSEGARHSANRAGLVACGGVGPALSALKAKRALDSEIVELVRFAASERYLELVTARAR